MRKTLNLVYILRVEWEGRWWCVSVCVWGAEDPIRADSEGVSTQVYFNTASSELAQIYGESVGGMVSYFAEVFGSPYTTTLAVVETGEFAPTAYTAPGIVFLSPFGIGEELNRTLLGAEVAHQWWRVMVSPGNRDHSWLDLGLAKYAIVPSGRWERARRRS